MPSTPTSRAPTPITSNKLPSSSTMTAEQGRSGTRRAISPTLLASSITTSTSRESTAHSTDIPQATPFLPPPPWRRRCLPPTTSLRPRCSNISCRSSRERYRLPSLTRTITTRPCQGSTIWLPSCDIEHGRRPRCRRTGCSTAREKRLRPSPGTSWHRARRKWPRSFATRAHSTAAIG